VSYLGYERGVCDGLEGFYIRVSEAGHIRYVFVTDDDACRSWLLPERFKQPAPRLIPPSEAGFKSTNVTGFRKQVAKVNKRQP
jgi:hypothetical protein